MAFEFDGGAEGAKGPFLVWTPRGTQDGEIGPKTFYIRDKDGYKEPTKALEKGVVFDFDTLKTGWQESGGVKGVAPSWKFGDTPAKLPPHPGEGWKKGFSIRVALDAETAVTWEQAGAAVFNAMGKLAKSLDIPSGKAPVVKLTGTQLLEFNTGKTIEPILEVVKYVPKPACLDDDSGGGGFDVGENERPAAKPAPEPAPEEDEIPF